jgi:hypothetical protein
VSEPVVLFCRPVDLDPEDPFDAEILRMTTKYTGSVESTCDGCDCRIWVGPRQQEAMKEFTDVTKGCFRCIAQAQALGVQVAGVRDLGNPEHSRSLWTPGMR